MAESFNGLCKTELLFHDDPWSGVEDVEWATFTCPDWFSTRRLHGEFGMLTPAKFETAYCRHENEQELVASPATEPR